MSPTGRPGRKASGRRRQPASSTGPWGETEAPPRYTRHTVAQQRAGGVELHPLAVGLQQQWCGTRLDRQIHADRHVLPGRQPPRHLGQLHRRRRGHHRTDAGHRGESPPSAGITGGDLPEGGGHRRSSRWVGDRRADTTSEKQPRHRFKWFRPRPPAQRRGDGEQQRDAGEMVSRVCEADRAAEPPAELHRRAAEGQHVAQTLLRRN